MFESNNNNTNNNNITAFVTTIIITTTMVLGHFTTRAVAQPLLVLKQPGHFKTYLNIVNIAILYDADCKRLKILEPSSR